MGYKFYAKDGNQLKLLHPPVETVNVKDFGAVGDGATDDTEAIQSAIDQTPRGEVYLPKGTYVVSKTLVTDADDDKTQKLHLEYGAVLKAASTFSGDWLVILGNRGTGGQSMYTSMHPPGFEGGHLDCSGVCNGLLSKKTHMARIHNFDIINAKTIGVEIDYAETNSSADAYVNNVSAYRDPDGSSSDDSIGFFINANDCDIRDIRCGGFRTGVRAYNSVYISNAHPIYGVMDDNYNASIGFDIKNARLVNCYSDNFSIALVQNGNAMWSADNFIAYWYTNTDHNHILFELRDTDTFYGVVNGVNVTYPQKGTNIGLKTASGKGLSQYQNTNYRYHPISGLQINEASWGRMTERQTDPLFNNQLLGQYSYSLGNPTSNRFFEVGKYYPLCILRPMGALSKFRINFQGKVVFLMEAFFTDSNIQLKLCQAVINGIGAKISLASQAVSIQGMGCFKVFFKIESMVVESELKSVDIDLLDQQSNSFYIIPLRSAHNYDTDYQGLDNIENVVDTVELPLGDGVQAHPVATFVKMTTLALTHSIPLSSGCFLRCYVRHGANLTVVLVYGGSIYRVIPSGGYYSGFSATINTETNCVDFVLPEEGFVFYEKF